MDDNNSYYKATPRLSNPQLDEYGTQWLLMEGGNSISEATP